MAASAQCNLQEMGLWPFLPYQHTFYMRFNALLDQPTYYQNLEELLTYECDACVLIKRAPDVVVLPASSEEVCRIVQLCNQHKIPFIARGGGTGLSGGALPMEGGVLIGLNRMNRILSIDPDNKTATVQAGLVNAWLNRALKPYNLMYAPDPSSQAACTIGGNIAENAGGIHCVKYGVTTDHILGLEVVTPEGDLIGLGGAHGHYQDVNWVGLFVGSEGTLGIATTAIVRLTPIASTIKVFLACFNAVGQATDTVASIIRSGLNPSALEFMDAFTVKAVNQAFHIGFPEDAQAVLLIELDGSAAEVAAQESILMDILTRHQVVQFRSADTEAERQRLWQARKGAVAAYGRILPAFYLHDCVIPRHALTDVIHTIHRIAVKYDVLIGNVFHAGDGNLHPNILLDPADADMVKRVLLAGDEILRACLAVGGVLSGEHGIGIEKAHFMPLLFTDDELAVMQRLRTVFNPLGLAIHPRFFR